MVTSVVIYMYTIDFIFNIGVLVFTRYSIRSVFNIDVHVFIGT